MSQRFFLYRRGAPCAFQLAELRCGYGVLQTEKIITHSLPTSSYFGSWSIESDSETMGRDVTFLQEFMNSESQYILYSPFVLKSSRNPSEKYRIINVQGVCLPRRGSLEVPLHTFSPMNLDWRSISRPQPNERNQERIAEIAANALLLLSKPQEQELPQLCQYIAQIVAQYHIQKKDICPIDLEPLTSYSTFLVPIGFLFT